MNYFDFKRKQMIETLAGDSLTTVEGVPPLSLPQSKGMNLNQYKVYGNSIQDGTPTPSAPIDIESVGDKTVNLLSNNPEDYTIKQTSTNTVTKLPTGISITGKWYVGIELTLKANTTYTFNSVITYDVSRGIIIYKGTGSSKTKIHDKYSSGTLTFTTDATETQYTIYFYSGSATSGTTTYTDLQIVEGSTALSEFEPYGYKIPVKVVTNSAYVKLPSDYTQVEYLQSSGTQYINTGLNLVSDDNFQMTLKGNFHSITSGRFQFHGVYGGAYFGVHNNGKWSLGNSATNVNADTDVHIFDFTSTIGNSKTSTFKIDDDSYTLTRNNATGNIYIFSIGSVSSYMTLFKMYYCKIWKNNTLVRELIPCYRNSDSVAGLYDLINDVFYTNVGTGEFEVGEEIQGTTTNIYLDESLRKVGDYADYIDFINQKVVRNISNIDSYNGETITTSYISSTGSLTTGANVIYVKSTPTEESVTLPSIATYSGQNYFSLGTTINASNALVKYYK